MQIALTTDSLAVTFWNAPSLPIKGLLFAFSISFGGLHLALGNHTLELAPWDDLWFDSEELPPEPTGKWSSTPELARSMGCNALFGFKGLAVLYTRH